MRHGWDAFACLLSDTYVFPAFEVALGLLFLYALGRDLRLRRTRRRISSGQPGADLTAKRDQRVARTFTLPMV